MNHVMIDGRPTATPAGIRVTNYWEDGEVPFKARRRRAALRHCVLHETAGRTADGAKRTMLRKDYGVHLIVDRGGNCSHHGDLVRDQMVHANQCNATSIGIEFVNPYAPGLAHGIPFETVPARWWTWTMHGDRRYVLPTPAQLRTLTVLVPWLCATLAIPYVFPTIGLGPRQRKIAGWNNKPRARRARPAPGVVAHRDFGKHADGRYLLEYLHENRE